MESYGDGHRFITCDGCQAENFRGTRYRCTICPDYDLCETCHNRLASSASRPPFPLQTHRANHTMEQIRRPREVDPMVRLLQLIMAGDSGDSDMVKQNND